MQSTQDIRNHGAPGALSSLGGSLATYNGAADYQAVPASSAALPLGLSGRSRDYLAALIITVNTVGATAILSITDGVSTLDISPTAGFPTAGTFRLDLGLYAKGGTGWKVTTGAGLSALAIGDFS
jgi:hypothetical protein